MARIVWASIACIEPPCLYYVLNVFFYLQHIMHVCSATTFINGEHAISPCRWFTLNWKFIIFKQFLLVEIWLQNTQFLGSIHFLYYKYLMHARLMFHKQLWWQVSLLNKNELFSHLNYIKKSKKYTINKILSLYFVTVAIKFFKRFSILWKSPNVYKDINGRIYADS